MRILLSAFVLSRVLFLVVSMETTAYATNWPSWRGEDGKGVVPEGAPPIRWSETENIKWKTDLPGEGQSTPIIWGDLIILQTAIPVQEDKGEISSAFGNGAPRSKQIITPYQFVVLGLSKDTGDILWQTEVHESLPHEGHHPSGSLAPYSPVTDGRYIWASFGSRGLYCLDMEGTIVWSQQTGKLKMAGPFGEGSSPLLVGDLIIVLADQEDQSKITAYSKQSGEIVWEEMRDEVSSWSSPVAAVVGDRTEIITSASNAIRSYDSITGKLIWESRGLTGCAAPTPVVSNGKVYCSTGFRGISTMVIELGHEGDLSESDAISWSTQKVGANVPSPLVYKNQLYVFKGYSSDLSSFNADTGEELFHRQRIEGLKQVYASPIGVNGYVYVSGRNGKTAILKAGKEFNVVAVNGLDTVLDGSPVVIGDELFLRGRTNIYCIAKS